jgi:cobalamin synthase
MMKHVDITFGVLGFLFSAFAYYYTGTFPENMNGEIGIAYFPRITIIGLGVCCLLLAITAFINKSTEKIEPFNLKNKGTQRAIICVVATVIYSLIIITFGFLVCTVVFILFFIFILKEINY